MVYHKINNQKQIIDNYKEKKKKVKKYLEFVKRNNMDFTKDSPFWLWVINKE